MLSLVLSAAKCVGIFLVRKLRVLRWANFYPSVRHTYNVKPAYRFVFVML